MTAGPAWRTGRFLCPIESASLASSTADVRWAESAAASAVAWSISVIRTIPQTAVRGLDSLGGWSQFKIRANSKLEFNAGFGLDNPYSAEIRAAAPSLPYLNGGQLLVQNRSGMVNFIYRPRSNLLFSTEYRYLQSLGLYSANNSADQINMMMGVLF